MLAVSTRWKDIGLFFGIGITELDKIEKDYRRNSDRCLTYVIAEWLKNHQPEPTWRKVCRAVAARAGGDNPSEAKRIADLLCSGEWLIVFYLEVIRFWGTTITRSGF